MWEKLVWFGLWHINHCRLFNTKSISKHQTVLFQAIQLSMRAQFSSVWPIGWTLSGATTPGQSGPRSDDNEEVLGIPQSSGITEATQSEFLVL